MKTIYIRGKKYNLNYIKGTVLETDKKIETIVSGSGGGGYNYQGTGHQARVNISSRSVVHDQLFLKDENNQEHVFQLADFNVACRKDNILTVVQIFKEGRNKGDNIAVINHDTNQMHYNNELLLTICNPKVNLIPFLLIAPVLIFTLISFIGNLVELSFFGIIFNGLLAFLCIFLIMKLRKSNFNNVDKLKSDIKSGL